MSEEGKYFYIRSEQNDLSLDLSEGIAQPGQPVVMWEHHGGHNQLWWEDKIHHCIRTRVDEEFVLAIQDGELVVDKWDRGNEDQKWAISEKYIHRLHDENQVLDIVAASSDIGAKVCQWELHGGPNQCWECVHVEPRYFYLRSGMNDKVLGLKNDEREPGTKIVTYEQLEKLHEGQMWWEDKHGYIRLKATGFAMDYDDERMRCNPFEDKPTQHWLYIYGGHAIKNAEDLDQCVDIKGEKDRDGASLVQYQFFNQSNQEWKQEYVDLDS